MLFPQLRAILFRAVLLLCCFDECYFVVVQFLRSDDLTLRCFGACCLMVGWFVVVPSKIIKQWILPIVPRHRPSSSSHLDSGSLGVQTSLLKQECTCQTSMRSLGNYSPQVSPTPGVYRGLGLLFLVILFCLLFHSVPSLSPWVCESHLLGSQRRPGTGTSLRKWQQDVAAPRFPSRLGESRSCMTLNPTLVTSKTPLAWNCPPRPSKPVKN